jgi:hypothetical protein
VEVSARLSNLPAAIFMVAPAAPGSVSGVGVGFGVSLRLLVASPSCPNQLKPKAYSCPVEVSTRLWKLPPAISAAEPVAPGRVTSVGVGLAVSVPSFVALPSCPK